MLLKSRITATPRSADTTKPATMLEEPVRVRAALVRHKPARFTGLRSEPAALATTNISELVAQSLSPTTPRPIPITHMGVSCEGTGQVGVHTAVPGVTAVAHGEHAVAPAELYWPTGHCPEHSAVVRPATVPYVPAGHRAPAALVMPSPQ